MDSGRTEDQALVARIVRHDRSALEQLYHRHVHWLVPRLESRCNDAEMVDIAVQDTFVSVWRSAKKYRGDGDVGAWIWGIAIRRLIDQTRKRKPIPIAAEALSATLAADQRVQSTSFEDELLASGAYGQVGPAIRRLEPDLQAVLVATAVDGLTTKEAGRLLGVPQGTVKTRLQRARTQLREQLDHPEGEALR